MDKKIQLFQQEIVFCLLIVLYETKRNITPDELISKSLSLWRDKIDYDNYCKIMDFLHICRELDVKSRINNETRKKVHELLVEYEFAEMSYGLSVYKITKPGCLFLSIKLKNFGPLYDVDSLESFEYSQ